MAATRPWTLDTASPSGRLVLHVLGALSEWERAVISERTSEALQHKKSQGERVGSVPLGYDLDKDGVHLIENPDEQAIVKRIRRLRRRGMGSRRIIERLEAEGLRPKNGGRWHPKVVIEVCRRS